MINKFLILVLSIALFSCSGKEKLMVDVSNIKIDLKVSRFDKELFEADVYKLRELNSKWISKYGILYESFLSQMIREGLPQDPMITYKLERFLVDSTIKSIGNQVLTTYKEFSPYEKELESAFQYYSYYFPDSTIPELITFYSNFNGKFFPYENKLGIGLDMFLGRNNEITQNLSANFFPLYYKQDMDPENLVSATIKNWVYYKFSLPGEYANRLNDGTRKDFLSTIIYHGKMMMLVDALMPNKSMATKFEYTKEEYEWCEKNEKRLYQTLIEHNLIYSTKLLDIASYVNPGNTTPGLPDDCPGGVGKWIGYKMVKQYYEENEITLLDLLSRKKDERKILSFYKP